MEKQEGGIKMDTEVTELKNQNVSQPEESNEGQNSFKVETKNEVYGVIKCGLLNVRKKPSIGSDIVDVLKRGNKVLINKKDSTDAFYRIYKDGIEGYCVKEYIEVI